MNDLWTALEEHSRDWAPVDRQTLADTIWSGYVTARFGRTGDVRAFDYLYPYLNHADRETQLRAIRVVATVFEGRGIRALEAIKYVTNNPRDFLKDRAVTVVGSTLKGANVRKMLPFMIPYLESRNTFTKKLAVAALGRAAEGTARQDVLDLLETHGQAWPSVRERAIARVFAQKPNEDVYKLLVGTKNSYSNVPIVVEGAGMDWFERADKDVFDPLKDPDLESLPKPRKRFTATHPLWIGIHQRDAVTGISKAGTGLGMAALSRMIHLARRRAPGHAMLTSAQLCFVGAEYDQNKAELIKLIDDGDVPTQRVAAMCLGRLGKDSGDQEVVDRLVTLNGSRNGAVCAAAIRAIGMVSQSTSDERLSDICFEAISEAECRRPAYEAIGDLFAGSGNIDIFKRLADHARSQSAMPARRVANRALAACYRAVGAVYRGTGSDEPFPFLVDILSLPKQQGHDVYRRAAARSLVEIEFAESSPSIAPRR